MRKACLLLLMIPILFSCSDNDPDSGVNLADEIIGGWILEVIRVEGPDCTTFVGVDFTEEYWADEEGCAVPVEVLGNAARCVNIDLQADGEGIFLWSEITGQEDATIDYTTDNNEFEYCFEGSFCSGAFTLVGDKLESSLNLGLDDECYVVYVLKRK